MWRTATAGGREVAYEHTEFTSGGEIRQAASNAGIGLQYPYDTTFFRFADYRTGAGERHAGVSIRQGRRIHSSDGYKTSFATIHRRHPYKMQMYSRISAGKKFENTVDVS